MTRLVANLHTFATPAKAEAQHRRSRAGGLPFTAHGNWAPAFAGVVMDAVLELH